MKRKNRIEIGIPSDEMHFKVRFTISERESLKKLAASSISSDRRLCIDYLRLGTNEPVNHKFVIEICDQLIPNRSQYVRWESLLLLGEFVKLSPEKVWPLVVKWGSVKNRDIRSGVACCVLEHILQHHFVVYFPKVKELVESGNKSFGKTLRICDKIGQAEEPKNAEQFDLLLSKINSGRASILPKH